MQRLTKEARGPTTSKGRAIRHARNARFYAFLTHLKNRQRRRVHPLKIRAAALFSRADFSGASPGTIRGRAPQLGEHTEDILLELGYDARSIERLRRDGVV